MDDGMTIRKAWIAFDISVTSLHAHLYGTTTSTKRDITPTLKGDEDENLLDYVFKMQDLGHPITPCDLCLMVAQLTQIRKTLWIIKESLLRWLRRFYGRHPELASIRSQGLEMARFRKLCSITSESFHSNLRYLFEKFNYLPSYIWNCDESRV